MHATCAADHIASEPQSGVRGTIYRKLTKRKALNLNFGKYRLGD
jgi:hypothetical protein